MDELSTPLLVMDYFSKLSQEQLLMIIIFFWNTFPLSQTKEAATVVVRFGVHEGAQYLGMKTLLLQPIKE